MLLPTSQIADKMHFASIRRAAERTRLDRLPCEIRQTASLLNEANNRLAGLASELSAGQQQRLCLARALSVRPEVLLCDEPTSALDPISASHIERQLFALKQDYTIVFVTHTLRQARRLADHVVFLYLGELIEQGPTETIFTEPSDPRTKAYIEGAFG
jgi:phosphate transport system ATP-binding protein